MAGAIAIAEKRLWLLGPGGSRQGRRIDGWVTCDSAGRTDDDGSISRVRGSSAGQAAALGCRGVVGGAAPIVFTRRRVETRDGDDDRGDCSQGRGQGALARVRERGDGSHGPRRPCAPEIRDHDGLNGGGHGRSERVAHVDFSHSGRIAGNGDIGESRGIRKVGPDVGKSQRIAGDSDIWKNLGVGGVGVDVGNGRRLSSDGGIAFCGSWDHCDSRHDGLRLSHNSHTALFSRRRGRWSNDSDRWGRLADAVEGLQLSGSTMSKRSATAKEQKRG